MFFIARKERGKKWNVDRNRMKELDREREKVKENKVLQKLQKVFFVLFFRDCIF